MSSRSVTTPVVDFVRRYRASGTARLHMPGHKGSSFLGCEPWDITEIQGADELFEAEGILAESEANATALFQTQHTYYSTEGSSQCIRAMLYLALQAAPSPANGRPFVLAARNAHKALLYACALLDTDAEWLWPEQSGENASSLCSCPVSPRRLSQTLETLRQQGRKPFAVYVTSPDYLGGVQDIKGLAQVCEGFSVPLLVDNAHGAYLAFAGGEGKLRHPIAQGAAMCCDSAHKTLPVLTGGAYLHIGPCAPKNAQQTSCVRGALALFGSTSPSYLILQSLDLCNRTIAEGWREKLAECAEQVRACRAAVNAACPGLCCAVDDPLRIVLDGTVCGMTGKMLADRLRQEKIECEYADDRFLVLMVSPENTPKELARIEQAACSLRQLDTGSAPEVSDFASLAGQSRQAMSIRAAMFAPQERIPVQQAKGRVCAMPAVSCPPAIPIAVSGERIEEAAMLLFQQYGIETVEVVKEEICVYENA